MSAFGVFMGGLGNAYNGYVEGRNEEQDRQYLEQQRQYELAEQQRTLAQQQREDQAAADIAALPPVGSPGGSASPSAPSPAPTAAAPPPAADGSADAAPAPAPAGSYPAPLDNSLGGLGLYGGGDLDSTADSSADAAPSPSGASAQSAGSPPASSAAVQPAGGGSPAPQGAASATGTSPRPTLASPPASAPAAAPAAGSSQPNGAGAPTVRSQEQELMAVADAYQRARRYDVATKYRSAAIQMGMQRAANEFFQIRAGAGDSTPYQIAQQAAQVYNNDPLQGSVTNVQQLPGGGVALDFANKQTGQTFHQTFSNSQDLLSALESHYSPATFAARAQRAAEMQIHTQEVMEQERAKGHVVGNGGAFIPGVGDPRQPVFNQRQFPPQKPGPTPASQVQSFIDDISQKGDTKLQPGQLGQAKDWGGTLTANYPGMPPERAARIATDAATDPTKTTPAINPQTGTIDLTYVDQDGSRYTLTPNYTNAADATTKAKLTPDQMRGAVQGLLTTQGSPQTQQQLVTAAFDPGAQKQLVAQVQASAQQAIDEAVQKAKASGSQIPEQTIRQNGAARTGQALQALQRKLELIKTYGDPKMAQGVGGAPGLQSPGGLPGYQGSNAPVPAQFQGVATRADQQQAAAAAAKTKQASDAKTARDRQQQAVGWLTPARIDALTPQELTQLLSTYSDQLTHDQAAYLVKARWGDMSLPQRRAVTDRAVSTAPIEVAFHNLFH